MTVNWEQPPPVRNRTSVKAQKLAREIASRPGEWAHIATYPPGPAGRSAARARGYAIKAGRVEAYNEIGTFETTVRSTPDGWKVYVRLKRGA